MFGFDHHGRWRTTAGLLDGAQTAVSMTLPSYDASVAAGATVTMPRAFTAMWSGDLDDMTNRLLDRQYRYMWDLTRREFYADIRLVGEIENGAHPFGGVGGPYDPAGLIQKVFGYADHIREIGGDGYHRDIGWYTGNGDWTGPDWGQTIPYLGKSDVRHTIYYSAYNTDPPAPIYQQHPEWFVNGSPCGYADRLADLSIAGAAAWVLGEISRNADLWGDYAWRNDSCPVANVDGATQLGQSQAFQRLQEQFLAAYPNSSVQNVDSGGYEIGWEMVRRASSLSFTDWNGVDQAHDGGSRLFNVDKLSGMGGNWPTEYCIPAWNMLLGINPEFVNDPDDPTAIDCMRRTAGAVPLPAGQRRRRALDPPVPPDLLARRARVVPARQRRQSEVGPDLQGRARPAQPHLLSGHDMPGADRLPRLDAERQRHRVPEGARPRDDVHGHVRVRLRQHEPHRRRPDEQGRHAQQTAGRRAGLPRDAEEPRRRP